MGAAPEVTVAGGVAPPATVVVWDRFVRFFHWALVGLFTVGYFTGGEAEDVHIVNGYALVSLLVLRVLWGLFGPRTARFSHFVRSPSRRSPMCAMQRVFGRVVSSATIRPVRR